ncbi:heterokaryon incompatibility protein-domain-containing protein [Schizothecium vesticola]|uniref:Heterokaryon incompatibility protein-domain-containing protein n=1 Tax=Schizothecium vesticola TaxID=314040 RepID=A0AA40F9Q1_9PEZI|nr:heterokaryon incompatibility protein-domain-containing protein [Schizothecium vesticola]
MKRHASARRDLVQVNELCPRRPFVELTVPEDALLVTAVGFKTLCRDEALDPHWKGSESFAWFEVAIRRPLGRSDVPTIKIHYTDAGNERFTRGATQWNARDSGPRIRVWLGGVRPGDIIQLVPRALFGWVNHVLEGSIEIEYQPRPVDAPMPALDVFGTGHVYQPLQHRQIRVLVVKPGAPEADLQASFEYISIDDMLDDKTGYHALSYYWGAPSETAPILIEAGEVIDRVGISQTLNRAIRRLRDPQEPLRIWIDALCINQNDLEERAQQVSMMGSVYTHAKRVHVWLDDDILGLDTAFRLIRDVHNCHRRICAGGSQCQCSRTKHSLSSAQLDEICKTEGAAFGFTREIFQEYQKTNLLDLEAEEAAGGKGDAYFVHFTQYFFHHPWFQRVWVIQEAILSPSTVLYSAGESILWEELLMVNDIITSPEYAAGERNGVQSRNAIPAIWSSLHRVYGKIYTDGKPRKQHMLPILDVFLKGLESKATDPRDKLFALLPFGHETHVADEIPPLLQPNYNKPVEIVMADFTRWWILEHRSLDILSSIHCQPTRAWRRTLGDQDPRLAMPTPSRLTWTVSTEGQSQFLPMTLLEHFPSVLQIGTDADALDADLVRSWGNPLELALRGRKIGWILALDHPPKELVYPYDYDSDKLLPVVFRSMFDPWDEMGVWLLNGINFFDPFDDAAGRADSLRRHVAAHFDLIPAPIQHALQPAADGGLGYDRHETEDLPACLERCFFILDDGRYGLCPWTAREGDVVAWLHGSKVLFLLRPVRKGEEEKRYQLVGECFVEDVNSLDMGDGTHEPEMFVLVQGGSSAGGEKPQQHQGPLSPPPASLRPLKTGPRTSFHLPSPSLPVPATNNTQWMLSKAGALPASPPRTPLATRKSEPRRPPPPHECSHCERFAVIVRDDMRWAYSRSRRVWRHSLGKVLLDHIRPAAAAKCPLFTWLWQKVQASGTPKFRVAMTSVVFKMYIGDTKNDFLNIMDNLHTLTVMFETDNYAWPPGAFELVSRYASNGPSADHAISRCILGDVSSPRSLLQVRERLAYCLQYHGDCRLLGISEAGVRPLRLLKLGLASSSDPQNPSPPNNLGYISLIQSDPNDTQPYTTLSYVWGEDQSSKTTKPTSPGTRPASCCTATYGAVSLGDLRRRFRDVKAQARWDANVAPTMDRPSPFSEILHTRVRMESPDASFATMQRLIALHAWDGIVHDYVRRRLSKPEDCLRAKVLPPPEETDLFHEAFHSRWQ